MISGTDLPTLTGARVLLRALTEADVPALFGIFSDPEVMEFWSHPPLATESEAAEYLEDTRRGFETRTLFQWGLCRRGDNALLGTCTLWQLDPGNRRAEIGFALGREHWRQGLMTEGLTVLIDYSFGELGLRRLEADVDPKNSASIGLLERLGFRREGLMRERWVVGEKVADSLFLGLLESGWRVGKAGS